MTKITDKERENFATLAKMLAPKNDEQKTEEDKFVHQVIANMRETYVGADEANLARFANSIAYVMARFAKLTVCELHVAIENMYQSYGLAGCSLAGVYDLGAPAPEPKAGEPADDPKRRHYTGQYL
jgi:hypothetical protein